MLYNLAVPIYSETSKHWRSLINFLSESKLFVFVIVLFQDVRSCTWYVNNNKNICKIYMKKKHEWKVDTLSDISLKASSSCQPLGKPFIFTKESCFGIGAGRLFYKKWKKNKQEIWRMRIGKFNDAMIAIDTSISTLTEVLYWEKHHLCLSSSSIWFNFDWKNTHIHICLVHLKHEKQ